MLQAAVCAKHNWKSIEQPSYGKGYVEADTAWRFFLRALTTLRDSQRMTIVLVAHSTIERVDDPRAETYTSYQPKLHKRARHLVMDAADIVAFLAEDLRTATSDAGFRERTRAVAIGGRQLFVEGTPAFAAKNRYTPGAVPAMPSDAHGIHEQVAAREEQITEARLDTFAKHTRQTPEMRAQFKRRLATQEQHDFASAERERLLKDPAFRQRVVNNDADAVDHWIRIVQTAAALVVPADYDWSKDSA